MSHLPVFERHRGCGSGPRRRAAMVQTRDGPAPRNPSAEGRATTFAGHGTSVSCLATYKPRHSCLFIRQRWKELQLLMYLWDIGLQDGNHYGLLTRRMDAQIQDVCRTVIPGNVSAYVYCTRRSPFTTRPTT